MTLPRSLKRLGIVLHRSKNTGNLILRAEFAPRVGERVLDSRLKLVGKVFDVFGPVSRPYVSVRPTVERPESYQGRPLYVAG